MIASGKKYRVHTEPRLSANQLSEYYTTLSPARRTAIISEAKYASTAVVTRYDGARDALIKHLSDATRSHHILSNAILKFQEQEAEINSTPWKKEDCRGSIEAIMKFQRSSNTMGISKLTFRPVLSKLPPFKLGGVNVSVNLSLIVERVVGGEPHVGGLIFLFSKTEKNPEIRKKRAKVSAFLIQQMAELHLHSQGIVDPKLCLVVDVLDGQSYNAGAGNVRLGNHLEHSCREVTRGWDDAPAPSDYSAVA